MSPSLASASTKAGSFFSSCLWKRVFSSRITSPSFIAAIACAADVADAIGGEADGTAEMFGHRRRHRPQRIRLVRPALRAAEMGEQDHLGALVGELADGRQHALDAGGVGDLAVLHRHVEIDAQQDALALHLGGVEGAELAHDSLFIDNGGQTRARPKPRP